MTMGKIFYSVAAFLAAGVFMLNAYFIKWQDQYDLPGGEGDYYKLATAFFLFLVLQSMAVNQ